MTKWAGFSTEELNEFNEQKTEKRSSSCRLNKGFYWLQC